GLGQGHPERRVRRAGEQRHLPRGWARPGRPLGLGPVPPAAGRAGASARPGSDAERDARGRRDRRAVLRDRAARADRRPARSGASPRVRRLFEDYESVERDYFRRTGIYPIMHTLVIRKDVYRKHPWVAQSIYAAFKEAKSRAYGQYKLGELFMHGTFMV